MAKPSKGLRASFRAAALVVVALLLLGLGLQLVIGRIFSADYLEELLEENLNALAEVGEVKVNLLAGKVTLRDLTLSPKDPSIQATGVEVGEVRLGVKVLPLFSRRLETTSFVIADPVIRMSLDREGELSLAELFRDPDSNQKKSDQAEESSEPGGVLEAEENRWLAKLGETRLEGGKVELLFEKERLLLKVEELQIALTHLQFDPDDLASLNTVQMTLSGRAGLLDSEKILLVNLSLSGDAKGQLFDEHSGEFDADILADLALGQGSYLNPQVKIVKRIWGYLDLVEKWGFSLGELPDRIEFGRSRRIVGTYRDDQITLAEPLSLSAGKWEVGLSRDSWIATESGLHDIGVEFLAGKKVSETLGGWLNALPKEAQVLAQSRFVDERQILWRVNSSGELGEPKFEFFSQIPETKGVFKELEESLENEVDKLKEKAGDFLKGFLD